MKSIKNKLIIIMVLIVLIPFVISNIFSNYFISKNYRDRIEANHLNIANSLSENVSSFVTTAFKVTEQIANNSDIKSYEPYKQEKVLKKTIKRNPYFDLLYIQGTDGMQTARSSGSLGDRSNRWWFKKTMNEKNAFVGKSYFSLSSNIPVTAICIPTYDKYNDMTGVMGADIKLDYLQQMVDKMKLNDGTYTYIVDSQGVVIAHHDKRKVSEQYNYKTLTKKTIVKDDNGNIIKDSNGNHKIKTEKIEVSKALKGLTEKVLNGKSGFLEYENVNGKEVVSAYKSIKLPGKSNDWAVITVQRKSDAYGFVNDVRNKNIFILLGLMVIVGFVAIFLSKTITKPLNSLKEAFNKASNGDLTNEVNIKTKDEFGDVGNSFNAMLKNIKTLIKDVKKASFTVLDSSKSLTDITNETTNATNEVASTIEEIANVSSEQAKITEQGANEIGELAGNIEKVSNSALDMDGFAKDTNNMSNKGIEIVKSLTLKSKKNLEATDKVNSIIKELDKRTEKIGKISQTIGEIAEQTNLLALNAAIEAARAGEKGKGFAVVADEIRKLAEESSSSVGEIKGIIEGIQSEAKVSVDAIEKVKEIVKNQDEEVKNTNDIFKKISQSIDKLTLKVNEVKDNTNNMTNKKNEIVSIIENISASSEETSASTQEVSASAEEQLASMEEVSSYVEELKNLSQDLQGTTNKFEI
ncbi:MAG: methyl-accepting chemotaxis protein [Firmicutes bacterium]|nr:methyl-accepting chemotaxis protein [Bacillota bacterium]